MNGFARPLLLAVYLTGTVLAPALHLIFHDIDHDHPAGAIRLHSHGEAADPHSHEHPHAHPHQDASSGHVARDSHHHDEDNSDSPEHGSNSAAHFDAHLSDGVEPSDPLIIPDRVQIRNAQHPDSRLEGPGVSRVRDRGPPQHQNRLT